LAKIVLIDTGPLVALIDRSEKEHGRVAGIAQGLPSPLWTVEPVLTEACFLLRRVKGGPSAAIGLVRDRLIRVGLSLTDEADAVTALLEKYADVPMSLADACLVLLSERQPRSVVFTFDSDFRVYRRRRREKIPLLFG
jgi:predicted nucleic acid-binding protein